MSHWLWSKLASAWQHYQSIDKLDKILVELSDQKREFECPDVLQRLRTHPQQAYDIKDLSNTFNKDATKMAQIGFISYGMVGGFMGYIVSMRCTTKLKRLNTAVFGIIGSMCGLSKATFAIIHKQIDLGDDNSMALETRYQLWKLHPTDHWLDKHQNDVQRWDNMHTQLETNSNDPSLFVPTNIELSLTKQDELKWS